MATTDGRRRGRRPGYGPDRRDRAGPLCGQARGSGRVRHQAMPAWFTEADLDFTLANSNVPGSAGR